MTAELKPGLVRSCPQHRSTAAPHGFSPAPRAAAVGPEHFCSCSKAWQGRGRQGRLPLAPEQLSSSGAGARRHLPGTRVTELEARRESQEKQLQVHWHSSVLCPPKRRAAWRQHQQKCQSGLSSALGLTRQEKEKSTELAVECPDPGISGSCSITNVLWKRT